MTQATLGATGSKDLAGRAEDHAQASTIPTIREVLFPSDLSPESDRAFGHARLLAERFDARLTLYHVLETDSYEKNATRGEVEGEIWRRAENAARRRLELWTEGLSIRHDIVVEREPSARIGLLERVRATHPGLTVMATHGREGIPHLLLGSVTEAVLEHGRCPVLCVREPEHGAALPYRRVLLPTDLSPASRRSVPLAALLARAFDAEVLAVHVVPSPSLGSLSGVPELVDSTMPSEAAITQFLAPDLTGLKIRARVEMGSPWERIIDLALSERADIIVMSTHGHDSLADRVIGSHTERVIRQSPCPVLVA